MAEFLIYNTVHWMNKLTSEEIAEHTKNDSFFPQKVAGQYQRDDVIEERDDGFWTGPKAVGFNKNVFRVISVPGLEVDTKYQNSNQFHKSRFKISIGSDNEITVKNSIEDLTITDKGT